MASHVGVEVLTKPRNITLAKDLVMKSGYAGEKVVMLSPSDRPVYSQMAQCGQTRNSEIQPVHHRSSELDREFPIQGFPLEMGVANSGPSK